MSQRAHLLGRCTLAAVAVLAAGPALAGPPFATDDPEPVPYRHWELYLAGQAEKVPGSWRGAAPLFEVNYGAAKDVQLHLIVPLAFASGPGTTTYGIGDTELGLKYRFIQEGEVLPQVGVFPLVELPTGDADRDLGAGSVRAYLPLWLQKSFGPWQTYGGAGVWINPGAGNRNWLFFGWQVQRQLVEGFTLGAEVFHTTPQSDAQGSETRFNLGVMLDLSERHHLIASAGRGVQGPNRLQAYAAYLITLGPAEPSR